jgi:hypothetical protein
VSWLGSKKIRGHRDVSLQKVYVQLYIYIYTLALRTNNFSLGPSKLVTNQCTLDELIN